MDLVTVEVLQDYEANAILAQHGIASCLLCYDSPIFAILIFHDSDMAIPVCGTCFRNAPLEGQVVS